MLGVLAAVRVQHAPRAPWNIRTQYSAWFRVLDLQAACWACSLP